ncbi:hypothetical protein V8B97DRAFT_2008880 [Scleroderma yunnanense]
MHEIQVQADSSASVSPPAGPGPSSVWHAIRPWTPHLTLAVREITSVSATFILSSALDSRAAMSSSIDGTETELILDRGPSVSPSSTPSVSSSTVPVVDTRRPVLADTDLTVVVNGSTWQRFIMRMHDTVDEAIVLIHGLHPGRQYDIDFALGGGVVGRGMVITSEEAEGPNIEEENGHAPVEGTSTTATTTATDLMTSETPPIVGALPIQELSPSTSLCPPSPAPSIPVSHSPSRSATPTLAAAVQTHEEKLRALSSTLSALNEEQATLQSSLKSTRRDAQKTATTLRTEIDVLRRASEKVVVAESKARQRVRALEDAVKRANEGREEVERETERNERAMPALREKEASAEEGLKKTREEADGVKAEKERKEEEVRKRKESTRVECASLSQKVERLGLKKERLEGSVIPDLEAQLAEIERKIELAERGGKFQQGEGGSMGGSMGKSQRRRQSHAGTIGWPSLNVGQRPAAQLPSAQVNPPIQATRHQPRSQSMYRKGADGPPPGLSPSPGLSAAAGLMHSSSASLSHSTASVSSGLGHPNNMVFNLPSSSPSSLSRSTNSTVSSTLSSKAAPFEPTRSFRASFPLSNPTASILSSGVFSGGTGQGTFGPSSSIIGSPLPSSTNGPGTPFLPSPVSSVFPGGQTGSGTLPPPIQRPSHVSSSSTGFVGASPSVTAQLMRLGRPAPAAISKVVNGESGARTTSGR